MEQLLAQGTAVESMVYITMGTVIFTAALKLLIRRDEMLMVVVLAFCATLMGSLNSLFQKQVGYHVLYWSNALNCYIVLLGTTIVLYSAYFYVNRIRDKLSITRAEVKLFHFLIYLTLLYCLLVGVYYATSNQFWQLLMGSQFLMSVGIIAAFLVLIFVFESSALLAGREEGTRRKLFHLAPIIVVPIIYSVDFVILVAILTAAVFVSFALEVIRYCLLQIKLTSIAFKEEVPREAEQNNWVFTTFQQVFKKMQSFNSRQPYFWFTPLFLILSLQLSYNMELITKQQGQGHIVLVFIAADAMAAIVGRNIGKIKLYRNKTFEGFLAFVVTTYCLMKLINNFYGAKDSPLHVLIVAIACGVTELFSGNADNVTTLLVYWLVQSRSSDFLAEA